MIKFKWTCPYCNHDAIVTESNYIESSTTLNIDNKNGPQRFINKFIVCPNSECEKFVLYGELYSLEKGVGSSEGAWKFHSKLDRKWELVPNSKGKVFPNYIPKAIIDDYTEAYLIKDLSPKASATLARRCLQGIVRDFWKVSKPRLIDEILYIKDKIDPLTWSAIDAIRKIGNIGAHMEKDINVIVDVDSNEALILLELIETLLEDWYITRHEREMRLKKIVEIKDKKEVERKKS